MLMEGFNPTDTQSGLQFGLQFGGFLVSDRNTQG